MKKIVTFLLNKIENKQSNATNPFYLLFMGLMGLIYITAYFILPFSSLLLIIATLKIFFGEYTAAIIFVSFLFVIECLIVGNIIVLDNKNKKQHKHL